MRVVRAFARCWTAVAVALTACAHVSLPVAERSDELRVRGVAVVLRYAVVDTPEAAQVRRALQVAVPVAERWGPLPPRITIRIHPTHDALEAASRQPDVWWLRAWSRRESIDLQSPRTWSAGVASDAHLARLLAHELTHCALFEAIGGERRLALGVPGWFREGMATSNAGERFATPGREGGALTTDVAFRGDDAPLDYAVAHEAFVTLEARYGRPRIRRILALVRGGVRFPQAFEDALGISLGAFESGFRSSLPFAPSAG